MQNENLIKVLRATKWNYFYCQKHKTKHANKKKIVQKIYMEK